MKIVYFFFFAVFANSFANAADLDTKIAASFAAKYDICSKKIKNADSGFGWKIKAGIAKEKADEINLERLLEQGYIKSFEKEKKKIKRNWNVKRCKKFVNQHIGN
jgi:ribosomal protein S8